MIILTEKGKKFPYLKVEGLSEEERERLLTTLNLESEKMQDTFAILVDLTRAALKVQSIPVDDLAALIEQSYLPMRLKTKKT